MSLEHLIEQRARSIVFHDGGNPDTDVGGRERKRAEQEVVWEQIDAFKTMDELRDLLHYLARKAGIT